MTSLSHTHKKKASKKKKRNIQTSVGRTQGTGPKILGDVPNKMYFLFYFMYGLFTRSSACEKILSLLS